jgi:hypothetical protein
LLYVDVEWGYLLAADDADGKGGVGAGAHAQEVHGANDGTTSFVVSLREGNLIGGRGRFDVTVVRGCVNTSIPLP